MATGGLTPEFLEVLRNLEELAPLQEDLDVTLIKITEVTLRLIDGADSASVTVLDSDEVRSPAASDETAILLDRIQYETGSGPCLAATTEQTSFVVDDLETDERWPEFANLALQHGFNSILSVPIKMNGVSGGLNIYGRRKNAFKDWAHELTDLLAGRAAIAIENARVYGSTRKLVEQLNEAIKSREIIGEAKGILMAGEGVSEDEAFRMLVRVSQNSNTKLRDVARKLIEEAHKTAPGSRS